MYTVNIHTLTDYYVDYNSHHDKQQKISTEQTLLHGAELYVIQLNEGKQQECKHLTNTFNVKWIPQEILLQVESDHVP